MALKSKVQKKFRITYRMEVYIEANTEDEAIKTFENANLQELADESQFVERVSIDEEEA